MSSTRLPGKVMRPILGRPMIALQLERLRRSRRIDRLVVATSDDASDDALAAFLQGEGTPVFRGPLADVLGRFAGALEAFGPADVVLRLTADCPLADAELIDHCIEVLEAGGADYVADDLERSYPRGLDAEVMKASVLKMAAREATSAYDREHVTPFIYNQPQRFRLESVRQAEDQSHLRWTVDISEDFDFVRRVYEALYVGNPAFTRQDVLALPFENREP